MKERSSMWKNVSLKSCKIILFFQASLVFKACVAGITDLFWFWSARDIKRKLWIGCLKKKNGSNLCKIKLEISITALILKMQGFVILSVNGSAHRSICTRLRLEVVSHWFHLWPVVDRTNWGTLLEPLAARCPYLTSAKPFFQKQNLVFQDDWLDFLLKNVPTCLWTNRVCSYS